MLAAEFGIPLLMYDTRGKVKARVWRPHFGSHSAVRHGQMDAAKSTEGLAWAREGNLLKAEGYISLLRWMADRLPSKAAICADGLQAITSGMVQLRTCSLEDEAVRSAEAQIGRHFWEAYFGALEHREASEKRTRRPAEDPLNALINYGYGMLYGEVESATLTAGLDPHIGFLHRDEYGKPSFVFDAIEPFRPWVDRLIAELVIGGKLQNSWFEQTTAKKEGGAIGILLSKPGKKEFIPAWIAMMLEPTLFNGKKIKRKDQIQARMTALAQQCMKGGGE
jgi:CRISPR-associated protein Cas1